MGEAMNWMSKGLSSAALAGLLACGGGGGGSAPAPAPAPAPPAIVHNPGISNLQFSPTSTTKGSGGGAISVGGSFNFTDAGGDMITFTVTSYYSSGTVASTGTIPITGTSGATVGTVSLFLNINTTVSDNFRFEAYATDALGSRSNMLSGAFLITDPPPTFHAPSISNFQFTPSTVTQGAGGGSVSVVGKFNFIDVGGDMTTVTYVFYNSAGAVSGTNTGPISGIAGITSGWVQTSFTASTNSVSTLRMDAYTTDALGSNSNTLSQYFQIVLPGQNTPPAAADVKLGGNNQLEYQFMTLQGAGMFSISTPSLENVEVINVKSSEFIK